MTTRESISEEQAYRLAQAQTLIQAVDDDALQRIRDGLEDVPAHLLGEGGGIALTPEALQWVRDRYEVQVV